ncbi:MAG: peptidylprolyl isomerase [Parvularculaceae bacterium]
MTLRLLVGAVFFTAALIGAAAAQKGDKNVVVRPYDIATNAPADAWRPLDLENTLVMDLPQGDVVIELRPDFAPKHVEQIKALVRQGFYDGLHFHRVIEGFMAQGGDPKGDGTGASSLPNVTAEFARDTKSVSNFAQVGRDRIAARVGFVDGMPAAAQPESLRSFKADREVLLWGLHCPGVMSMARATDLNSANSQFFLMIGDARLNLDRRYTVWGWIVDGFENSRRIVRGEPPPRPTPIIRVRVAADIPNSEKPDVLVMKTDSPAFKEFIEAAGYVKDGFVRNMCSIKPPRKVGGQVEI